MSGVDLLARTLARSAADTTTRLRTVDRLSRSIARIGSRLPGVMAAPPTIGAVSGTATVPGATATTFQAATGGALISPARFTLVGAAWAAGGGGWPLSEVVLGTLLHGGDGSDPTANAVAGGGRIRFTSHAPQLDIVFRGTSGATNGYRLKVDGEYVQTGTLTGATSNGAFPLYLPISWGDGSATYRKLRHYELECAFSGGFGGVRSLTIYPPAAWPVEDRLRMLVHGDSMVNTVVDSGAGPFLHGATHDVIAALTGQPDCWNSGVGGSGWIANASGTRSTFNQRVALDVVANAPDVIWELGGLNDATLLTSQAQLQALVETWLATVTAALPNVVIVMTGPICPKPGITGTATVRDAKAAAAAKYPRNVVFVDNVAAAWTTGTGRQGATAGDGNADWATGTDSTHPTQEGHVHNARRIVAGAAAGVEGLR